MASSYTATDAEAYEHLMGRWSAYLAEQLIAFAGIETGDRVLDVGCGTAAWRSASLHDPSLRRSWVSISPPPTSPSRQSDPVIRASVF
jgi:hypothetical protein